MRELTKERVVLALGYFDSLHLGHRHIISIAREAAERKNIGCAVATFSNNAYALFGSSNRQVYTYAERCRLLEGLCDYVFPLRFDSRLKNCSAEKFLNWLFSHHDISCVVCGYDYLFGREARGDAALLKEYCTAHAVECIVSPRFDMDGERVSTSLVKHAIEKGDIATANKYLSEPFFVTGRVVRGRGAGRMFDIPTANIKFSAGKLLPAMGVYGTTCVIDGKTYTSATNVGGRPTFSLTKTVVETMIKDFNANIYDKEITVYFHERLRDIIRFDSPEKLSKQVHADLNWRQTR